MTLGFQPPCEGCQWRLVCFSNPDAVICATCGEIQGVEDSECALALVMQTHSDRAYCEHLHHSIVAQLFAEKVRRSMIDDPVPMWEAFQQRMQEFVDGTATGVGWRRLGHPFWGYGDIMLHVCDACWYAEISDVIYADRVDEVVGEVAPLPALEPPHVKSTQDEVIDVCVLFVGYTLAAVTGLCFIAFILWVLLAVVPAVVSRWFL